MLLLRSYTDLPDDLTVCSEVLSCFFDHPSIDANKTMSLSPFKGSFEVSILFLLRGVNYSGIILLVKGICSAEVPHVAGERSDLLAMIYHVPPYGSLLPTKDVFMYNSL